MWYKNISVSVQLCIAGDDEAVHESLVKIDDGKKKRRERKPGKMDI